MTAVEPRSLTANQHRSSARHRRTGKRTVRSGEAVRHTAGGVYLVSGYTDTLRISRYLAGYRMEIQLCV